MSTKNKALLPYRDYDEHDVINDYALTTVGLAGQLVKITVSDPDAESFWSTNPVGASYNGVVSNLFENPNKVAVATAADDRYSILGITLCDTITQDANGNNLVTANPSGLAERGAVYLGQSVPVAQRGRFSMRTSYIEGTPAPGKVVIAPTDPTKFLAAVDAGDTTEEKILGRWISGVGTRQGGYADFTLNI